MFAVSQWAAQGDFHHAPVVRIQGVGQLVYQRGPHGGVFRLLYQKGFGGVLGRLVESFPGVQNLVEGVLLPSEPFDELVGLVVEEGGFCDP